VRSLTLTFGRTSCIPEEVGDIEPEWAMFRASIVEAAAWSGGQKAVCACRGRNLRGGGSLNHILGRSH